MERAYYNVAGEHVSHYTMETFLPDVHNDLAQVIKNKKILEQVVTYTKLEES